MRRSAAAGVSLLVTALVAACGGPSGQVEAVFYNRTQQPVVFAFGTVAPCSEFDLTADAIASHKAATDAWMAGAGAFPNPDVSAGAADYTHVTFSWPSGTPKPRYVMVTNGGLEMKPGPVSSGDLPACGGTAPLMPGEPIQQ